MNHKWFGSIAVGLAGLVLMEPAVGAAELQLVGDLSVVNRTTRLNPDQPLFRLPGGLVFNFQVWGDPPGIELPMVIGETELDPSFWPDPGESFFGPVRVDFLTPGAGIFEEDPFRIDGMELTVRLQGPVFPSLGSSIITTFGPVDSVPDMIGLRLFESNAGPPIPLGNGIFFVDAIVPEPSTGASLCALLVLGSRSRRRPFHEAVGGCHRNAAYRHCARGRFQWMQV